MEKNALRIGLGGEFGVDIDTLQKTLDFVKRVNSIQNEIYEVKSTTTLRKTSDGSFIMDFIIMPIMNDPIGTINLAASFITIVGAIVNFKKFIGKDKPESVEKGEKNYVITNNNGDTFNIDVNVGDIYFKNDAVDESLTKMISTINKDDKRTDITISDGENSINLNTNDLNNVRESLKPSQYSDVISKTKRVVIFNGKFTKSDFTFKTLWKVEDVNSLISYSVRINDDVFKAKVEEDNSYALNKVFKCEMLVIEGKNNHSLTLIRNDED